MKAFIDSSFYISLLRKEDDNHKKAMTLLDSLSGQPVVFYTSDSVIDEVATVLSMRISKAAAVLFLHSTQEDDFPILLPIDLTVRAEGRKLFTKQTDKNISMIDCYSAVLMQRQQIKKCFTFDKQFRKLGFEIL